MAEENYMSQSYHPGSSAHRRRTDLMPTITFNAASPASGLSRSSTPGTRMLRSPGKAVSMSRLDALSKPRNHINSSNNNKALHENQKQLSSSPTSAHQAKRQLGRVPKSNHSPPRKISQSMSHLGPRIKPKLEVAKGRSPSAMSGTDSPTSAQVRMRPATARRPRPLSIATTGVMSTSMYEKRSTPATTPTRPQPHNGFERAKTPKRPVGKSMSVDKDDTSTSSSTKVRPRTPAQVKADSAARKAKSAKSPTPSKSVPPAPQKEPTPEIISDKDKDVETEETTVETPVREATPDIIRKSPVKEVPAENGQQQKSNNSPAKEIVENGHNEEQSTKKIITSEEEAKARLAEKRREMKEKMEREAEIERQRQFEEERKEAERLAQQEEEERKEG